MVIYFPYDSFGFSDTTGNINYEESVNEAHRGNAFNASAYEMPVDTLSAHTRRTTEHCQYHEQIGAAAMYEYATSGPNEQQMVMLSYNYVYVCCTSKCNNAPICIS